MDGKEKMQGVPYFKASLQSKTEQLIATIGRAVNKALVVAGIFVGSMSPVFVSVGTAASTLSACSSDNVTEELKDVTPPTITLNAAKVDVTGGKPVRISGSILYIGDKVAASWSDETSKECKVELSFNGKVLTSGTTLSEDGPLSLSVQDEAGNVRKVDIQLDVVKGTPQITINTSKLNIFGGVQVNVSDNQLLLGDSVIATWKDDNLESCKVSLNFNGKEIKSGDTLNEAGTLNLSITNKYDKAAKATITLTNDAILGLEKLQKATMQVDKEIDLLKGLTFAEGVTLVKTEMEIDGKATAIPDAHHYAPEYPGTCNLVFTVKGKKGNATAIKVVNLTINPIEYKAISIKNLKPADILPIVNQVEVGDKKCYEHIEHLRVAEATRIRDMMRKYGAGSHSPEQYQQLMSRLNTGMMEEIPNGYDNFERIGGGRYSDEGGDIRVHPNKERSILNSIISHANFKVLIGSPEGDWRDKLDTFAKANPNSITILGCSAYNDTTNKENFDRRFDNTDNRIRELCKSKKVIIFVAGGNICPDDDTTIINKTFQSDEKGDGHGTRSLQSYANGKNDKDADIALLVTIGTNASGNIDQTGTITASSVFPVGFHDQSLFSGRAFPTKNPRSGKIEAEGIVNDGKYATSYTNYVNVAMTDLCFQMFAEVKDADKLLDMIRATCLTDHISLDGKTQPLQLINPAGFFQKYLMPTSLPASVKASGTVSLSEGYYKGVIFDIPGAEVKVDGKWIAYSDANKALILAQNPFKLEWRLNDNLCKKLGYDAGKPLKGKVIVVDDKWNGLNIIKEFSVNMSS